MPSEHEFLQQRLQMVRRLHTAERDVVYDGYGRGRKATIADEVNQENSNKREARLLAHILAVTKEGQVERALQQWRTKFGAHLAEHRAHHKAAFDEDDAWWSIPRTSASMCPSRHGRRRPSTPTSPGRSGLSPTHFCSCWTTCASGFPGGSQTTKPGRRHGCTQNEQKV